MNDIVLTGTALGNIKKRAIMEDEPHDSKGS